MWPKVKHQFRVGFSALLLVVGVCIAVLLVDFFKKENLFHLKLLERYELTNATSHDHKDKESIRVVLFGDSGSGGVMQEQVAKSMWSTCHTKTCDFAIGLGDNFYPAGVSSLTDPQWMSAFLEPYKPFITESRTDFWMVVGNHDRRGSINAQIKYSSLSPTWRMPAPDYGIPNLPDWLGIYVLDTSFIAPGSDFPPYQRDMELNFAKQLARAKDYLCDRPGWRIIATHHPLYSSGARHNSFRESNLRSALMPFVKECGVNLVFSGHEHHQQHLSANWGDMVIQGAASSTRIRSKPLAAGDEIASEFLVYQPGFAVLEISSAEIKVAFYNHKKFQMYASRIHRKERSVVGAALLAH
ncbi:MAG: tartrate-resistant acid phosphatase type 5 [Halieaceae bacterium]|jgi:tartrate-resistant acid phosphatase type 5